MTQLEDLLDWLLDMQHVIDDGRADDDSGRDDLPERTAATLQVLHHENQELRSIARAFIEMSVSTAQIVAMVKGHFPDGDAHRFDGAIANLRRLNEQAREILAE